MSAIARFERVSPAQYESCRLPHSLDATEIPLPRRATAGSAGYDFVCPADVTLAPGEALTIPTGIRCRMESGWVLMMFPRSGLGFKHRIALANTVGVIDSDYYYAENEGHILIRLVNSGEHTVHISRGDRFCQGVLLMHGLAVENEVSAERSGGFGSTGE